MGFERRMNYRRVIRKGEVVWKEKTKTSEMAGDMIAL